MAKNNRTGAISAVEVDISSKFSFLLNINSNSLKKYSSSDAASS